MQKVFFIALFVFISLVIRSQNTVGLSWGKAIGSGNDDYGRDIAVDGNGNVYTVGYFNGTIDFDPGPSTFALTSLSDDIFITKFNSAGVFVWAGKIGGTGTDIGISVTTDTNNNIFFVGCFSGIVDFDFGPGTYNVTSKGPNDLFVCKIDANGSLLWVQNFGEWGSGCYGRSIDLDALGNIYVTGEFYGNIDFDNGPGFNYLYSVNSGNDIFTLKLNALGNFVWVKGIGNNTTDYSFSISLDAAGNVLTLGHFSGTIDMDPGIGIHNLTAPSSDAIFISKLDPNGNFTWAKAISGNNTIWSVSLETDISGNIFCAGYFNGTVDFDPGPSTYTVTSIPINYSLSFILKLDALGNFGWVKTLSGNNSWVSAYGIALDLAGNIYTTGEIEGTIDFNPGPGIHNVISNSNSIYIHKLDVSGNFLWADQLSTTTATTSQLPWAITTDVNGNVYLGGAYSGIIDFDPGPAMNSYTASGQFDVYVAKYCQTISPTITANSVTNLCQGDSIILSSSSANSFSWSTGSSSQSISVNSSGTYYVYTTNSNGCSSSAQSISVAVNPIPIISVTSGSICLGGSFTITPSGAATYTISGGSSVVSPTINNSYSVTGTSLAGCTSSIQAVSNITVNALPVINIIANPSLICSGQTSTISASGANSYSWNNNSTSSFIIVSPTVTTSYTVTGIDLNNCENVSVYTQSVSTCTGLYKLESEFEFEVFPNPTAGDFIVNINSDQTLFDLLILNGLGQIVHKQILHPNENKIKTIGLNQGIYYYKLIGSNHEFKMNKLIIE